MAINAGKNNLRKQFLTFVSWQKNLVFPYGLQLRDENHSGYWWHPSDLNIKPHSFPPEKIKVWFYSHHLLLWHLAESNFFFFLTVLSNTHPTKMLLNQISPSLNQSSKCFNYFSQYSVGNYVPYCINMQPGSFLMLIRFYFLFLM